jgi:hypothetical protein
LCSIFDFDQLNNQQIYLLMKCAYKFENYFVFCYFTNFIKYNEQLLFLFLLDITAYQSQYRDYYDYLIGLLKPWVNPARGNQIKIN